MVSVISKTIKPVSWADIVDFNLLISGDIIPITFKNGEQVNLEVAHDERGEQFIVFPDCLKQPHNMNDCDTNRSCWRNCGMREYAQEIYDLLPDDLQAIIIPTTIVQCINGERIECEDKLFCLSFTQVFGVHPKYKDMEPEDSQLDIYKLRRNRVKGYGVGNNNYCWWWLRSPDTSDTMLFRVISPDGTCTSDYASGTNGVCFGFRIRKK